MSVSPKTGVGSRALPLLAIALLAVGARDLAACRALIDGVLEDPQALPPPRRELAESPDADAVNVPHTGLVPLGLRAELADRFHGIQNILAFEQAVHHRLADREGTQQQGSVGYRFIARQRGRPGERAGRGRNE